MGRPEGDDRGMKYPAARTLLLSFVALMTSGAFQACKKKDEASATPLDPPTLEFLGASNTQGDEFEPGDDLVIGCDGFLTLALGPEGDDVGTIQNWTLHPPNICGSLEQCGYVTIELLDSEGAPVATFEQAVASPLLNLSEVELSEVTELRATLTLGDSGVPFENDGVVVSAVWEAEISLDCDESGTGGAGGADPGTGGGPGTGGAVGSGGNDGSGGAPAPLGGAGGLGGSQP